MGRLRRWWGLWMLLCAAAPTLAADQGLLWRIERAGYNDSYLFATMHTSDPRVTSLSVVVEQQFSRAESFTMEATIDVAAVTAMRQRMRLGSGRTLSSLIDATLYRRVVAAMAERGIPEAGVASLKPWAIYLTLSAPPGNDGAMALDLQLMQRALRHHKPIHGLERIDEQLDIFDGLREVEQVTLLRDLMADYDNYPQRLETMTGHYLRGDLAALLRLSMQEMAVGDAALQQRLMTQLLDQRNRRMVERMGPRLRAGGAFIAIGALHLPGEQGLLQLLRAAGYRLSAIK